MTLEVLAGVLSEFEWPAPYTLEDRLPRGILMTFPRCHLFFAEVFTSDLELYFLLADTGLNETVTLKHVLIALREDPNRTSELPDVPLIPTFSPQASLEKVQNGARNLCRLVLTHLSPCILGDFSWLEIYKAYRARHP